MHFTSSGLVKGLIFAILACALAVAGLRMFGFLGDDSEDDAASLSKQALEGLEAVRKRQPGDRRPASYDAVLAPLDTLLRRARDLLASESYNPINDYDKVRALTMPVMEIGALADAQARRETGYLTKEYRFNDQRGEAGQYLALALWERIHAARPRVPAYLDEPQPLPVAEMTELRRILDESLAVAPDNRDLWYLRGIVNRAEGLFAPAAKDLERAVEIDAGYAPAWNVLGLVRIALKEFDRAEDALERARALALEQAKRFNLEPGAEYTAILNNLANFHEGLATYYARENRLEPTVESRRLLDKHAAEARRYLQEFLSREPAGSPDAQAARAKLSALPQ